MFEESFYEIGKERALELIEKIESDITIVSMNNDLEKKLEYEAGFFISLFEYCSKKNDFLLKILAKKSGIVNPSGEMLD